MKTFNQHRQNDTLMNLYVRDNKPPVKNGQRDSGGSHRTAFWAGYDGLKKGLWPPPKGGPAGLAYAAGVAYKKLVKRGTRPALPDRTNGIFRK